MNKKTLMVGAVAVFAVILAISLGSNFANTPSATEPSTTASIVGKADGPTQDVYTTVAGQTIYPLKSRYTGDFL